MRLALKKNRQLGTRYFTLELIFAHFSSNNKIIILFNESVFSLNIKKIQSVLVSQSSHRASIVAKTYDSYENDDHCVNYCSKLFGPLDHQKKEFLLKMAKVSEFVHNFLG